MARQSLRISLRVRPHHHGPCRGRPCPRRPASQGISSWPLMQPIGMRAARFLRKGFCLLQQRRNQLQAGPGQPSSVKEYDGELPHAPRPCRGRAGCRTRRRSGAAPPPACRPEPSSSVPSYSFMPLFPAAAERFGGWKSAEILFGDEAPRQSVIGRCARPACRRRGPGPLPSSHAAPNAPISSSRVASCHLLAGPTGMLCSS